MGATGALEHGGNGGGVEVLAGLAVDRDDGIAGLDAGLEAGRAFKGGEDDDLGGGGLVPVSGLVGLRLDGHADAIVATVLVFAHLGEGLGVVEVGVRVEDVEHARDGAVVDDLVGAIRVQGIGVVLLDDGVNVGELMERVAEGRLVRRGLCSDLLADDGADNTACREEDGDGEECAAGTWSHWLGVLGTAVKRTFAAL